MSVSVDDLFLKASEMPRSQRRKFLRTLPPDVRVKVETLLAADASLEDREFLEQPIQKERTPDRVQRKDEANPQARQSSRSRSMNAETSASIGFLTRPPAIIASVLACMVVGYLIVDLAGNGGAVDPVVEKPANSDNEQAETPITVVESDSPTLAEAPTETQIDLSEQSDTNPEEDDSIFSAIKAPPLTAAEIAALPSSIGPSAPVSNPIPIPGVRSWTVETQGYRVWGSSLALSPDGRVAAIGAVDDNLRIVDVRRRKLINVIVDAGNNYRWASDNRHLFRKDAPGIQKLDTVTGLPKEIKKGRFGRFALDSSRERIYVVGQKEVLLLSTEDLSVVERVPVEEPSGDLRMSGNDKYFLITKGQTIHAYRNTRPAEKLLEITRGVNLGEHTVSNKGVVAAGWDDGRITTYDIEADGDDALLVDELVYPDGYRDAHCNAWLEDNIVLTTGTHQTLGYFDVYRGKMLRTFPIIRWHPAIAYDQSLRRGLILGESPRVVVDGKPTTKLLETDVGLMSGVTFSSDGSSVITNGDFAARFHLSSGTRTPQRPDGRGCAGRILVDTPNRFAVLGVKDAWFVSIDDKKKVTRKHMAFPSEEIVYGVWAEKRTSILAKTRSGRCLLVRSGAPAPFELLPPDGDTIRLIGWDERRNIALILGPDRLLAYDPVLDNWQVLLADLPVTDSRTLEPSPDGRHLAMSGAETIVLDAQTYEVVRQLDWKYNHVRWQGNDVLLGFDGRASQMRRVLLADPQSQTEVFSNVPFHGLATLSISPTAPIGVSLCPGNVLRIFDCRNGSDIGHILPFQSEYAFYHSDGKIVNMSPGFRGRLIYVLRMDDGFRIVSPAEFQKRYGKYLAN